MVGGHHVSHRGHKSQNDISAALGHAAAAAAAARATYKASSLQTITNYLQLITL
jgi:hypothetical protein